MSTWKKVLLSGASGPAYFALVDSTPVAGTIAALVASGDYMYVWYRPANTSTRLTVDKLDLDGNVIWSKSPFDASTDGFNAVYGLADNASDATYWVGASFEGSSFVYILKLNSDGTVAWAQRSGSSDFGRQIAQDASHIYAAASASFQQSSIQKFRKSDGANIAGVFLSRSSSSDGIENAVTSVAGSHGGLLTFIGYNQNGTTARGYLYSMTAALPATASRLAIDNSFSGSNRFFGFLQNDGGSNFYLFAQGGDSGTLRPQFTKLTVSSAGGAVSLGQTLNITSSTGLPVGFTEMGPNGEFFGADQQSSFYTPIHRFSTSGGLSLDASTVISSAFIRNPTIDSNGDLWVAFDSQFGNGWGIVKLPNDLSLTGSFVDGGGTTHAISSLSTTTATTTYPSFTPSAPIATASLFSSYRTYSDANITSSLDLKIPL